MLEKPFVQIMSAVSLDGKLTLGRGLSSSSFMPYVPAVVGEEHHKGRAEVDAIMVGATTVIIDNPSLTVRSVEGKSPIRVVPDPEGLIPVDVKIFNDGKAETIVAVTSQSSTAYVNELREKGVGVIYCGDQKFVDFKILLTELKKLGVSKLMVEGGATLINLFLSQSLVDEIKVFLIPVVVGNSSAPAFSESVKAQENTTPVKLSLKDTKILDDCLLITYQPEY
jgi:5-amino-6-(5-phosphoribosylamino)uracil reductase